MDQATIFDEPHYVALERLAANALAERDYRSAFEFSDRRCRIEPPPMSHSFLLRAEASYRLAWEHHAIADLKAALEIAPEDILANRRMMTWGSGPPQIAAARVVFSLDRDIDVRRRALEILRQNGEMRQVSMRIYDEVIEGCVVWNVGRPAEITIKSEDADVTYYVEPDPSHPLGNREIHAAEFRLPRPRSSAPQSISVAVDGDRFYSRRTPANERIHRALPRATARTAGSKYTVIVPIYDDFDATRDCLDSLFEATNDLPECQILLVDDATPNPQISRYLAELVGRPHTRVLTNRQNQGFVGSVNRALEQVGGGDVILLNSDTIVPPGFVQRLSAAAYSASGVGTVTPLSNNGEFASFPIPNLSNPLGSLADIILLDQIAAAANPACVVDLPSGIGFCLYMTRACLDAVGRLSENYRRGYLEDVDFCLRARDKGFRNVCAASVFVGHAGSRSFKAEKRALVMRNLDVLDVKFPYYREECAAFIKADPLRVARDRIEQRLLLPSRAPRLVVSRSNEIAVIAERRAGELEAQGRSALRLEISGTSASPIGPNDQVPQNRVFGLEGSDLALMRDYLREVKPSCLEIWDPAGLPEALVETLMDGDVPFELFIADAGLAFPNGSSFAELVTTSWGPDTAEGSAAQDARRWRKRGREMALAADAVVVPSEMAAAFVRRCFPDIEIVQREPKERQARRVSKRARANPTRLGILPLRRSSDEFMAMLDIVRSLREIQPEMRITILGETIDDVALMRMGNCFVTARIVPEEVGLALDQHAIGRLLIGPGRPLFGHPADENAAKTGIPIARLDWSFGQCRVRKPDIVIDPRSSAAQIAEALVRWSLPTRDVS